MNQLFINFKVFVNMRKNLFLMAMAAVAFAACSDDFADAPPVVTPVDEDAFEKPIVFSSASSNITRATFTGATAAEMLDGNFVVSGYKGSQSTWDDSDNKKVFDNFQVVWEENTANTTESNTSNWEYVGKGVIKHATDNGITRQSIKYWDYTQLQYDFIAWSTGKRTPIYEGTPAAGQVLVSSIDPSISATKAYTFTGTAEDLSQCYIADLVTVKKSSGNYGKPVVLTFRSLGTKVRIGIYETIPGYSVKNVKFYSAAASNDATEAGAKLFTTTDNSIFTEGTYTVYYPTVDKQSTDPDATDGSYSTDANQAHISFSAKRTDPDDPATAVPQSTTVEWGALNYTIAEDAEKTEGAVFLGRSSNTASFAGTSDGNYYVFYLPNEAGTNLNLRVDYTLEAIDGTGEEINVRGATAQVPSIYAEWKPGVAYTYLFKISDKTNGYTGVYDPTKPDDISVNSDPAGLYPITFDAMVVDAEDNGHTQETITTVSTPSITTYQQKSTVVNANEYTANGNDIFVTVNDGNEETTPDLANGKLVTLKDYSATSPVDDMAALFTIPAGKTEADVVDAMTMQEDHPAEGVTIQGRNKLELTAATYTLTDKVEFGADGNAISVGTDRAMRFTPASGTYAFVYTKKAPTTTKEEFQPVTKAAGTSVAGLYRYGLKNAPAGDVQEGVLYFLNKTSGKQTVFLGQKVDNLYVLDGTDYKIASGYAKTGTTYYYTTDNGMTYTAAHIVEYDQFSSADLYTDATATTPKGTETSPIDGQAYYNSTGVYCVIYPQRTNGTQRLMIQNTTAAKVACTSSEIAYDGMSYFDRYNVNNGVYYAKIIKVE